MVKRSWSDAVGVLVAFFYWLAIWGCGGGEGTGSQVAGGGIGGTGISIGSVSGVGSIIVNGSRYATDSADVFIEGEFVGTGDDTVINNLDIGKVVRVEAEFVDDASRTAIRIRYNDNVEGPVDSINLIDVNTGMIVVMGQLVMVDAGTQFRNVTLQGIALGNVLEVSGFVDELGGIHATFIEKKADVLTPGDEVDLKGVVQNLDAFAQTFRIQLLLVDYSSANILSLPGDIPVDGQLLEIKGALDETGRLVANRITVEDELGADNAEIVEIQGFITDLFSVFDFFLSGNPVKTDISTVFEGLAPGDLAIGEKVIVTGELKDRVVIAEKIRLP